MHLTKLGEASVSLFLAHGVTLVRDMDSDLEEVLRWRREIASPRVQVHPSRRRDRSWNHAPTSSG